MKYPKISIITPSLNQGDYIEQTIKSVLDERYPNLEYIIIDGGSTDNTLDIIKKYEKEISYWISEPDEGQSDAITKGLAKASGDVFNWLNSDDYLEPGALKIIAEIYSKKHPNAICGFTHCFWQDSGNTSHTYRMGIKSNPTNTFLDVSMNQPGTFYRMSVIRSLDGLNTSLKYVFDNELWMRFIAKYGLKEIVNIPHTLAHFRQHGSSKSFRDGFGEFYKEKQMIYRYILSQLNAPQALTDLYIRDYPEYYYKPKDWDMKFIHKDKLLSYFLNRYKVALYNEGFTELSYWALWKSIKYGYFSFKRKELGLFLRYLLKKNDN